MPVAVMEPQVIEDKCLKKKKKQEDEKVNNNKRISDFFKTPEKEVVSKQKSLFQFFSKSNSVATAKDSLKSAILPDKVYQHTVANIIDLSNTDKENELKKNKELTFSNVIPIGTDSADTVEAQTKDKSDKKKKRKKKEKRDNDTELQVSEVDVEEPDVSLNTSHERKHKKHKKKKKEEFQESDSVILLSDSSSSNPPSNKSFVRSDSKDSVEDIKNLEDANVEVDCACPVKNDKLIDDHQGENENNESLRRKDNVVTDTCLVTVDGEANQSKMKKNKAKNDNFDDDAESQNIRTANDSVNSTDIIKELDEQREISETCETNDSDEDSSECKHNQIDCVELNLKDDTNTNSSATLMRKKAMKCEDMKNLLKEIKGTETKEKKKKKHKNKHKHKPKLEHDETDILTNEGKEKLDCEENNLNEVRIEHNERNKSPTVDGAESCSAEDKKHSEEKLKKESLGVNSSKKLEQSEDKHAKESKSSAINNANKKAKKTHKKKSKLKQNDKEVEHCNEIENTNEACCKSMSYAKFKNNLEQKDIAELGSVKNMEKEGNDNCHEISYTDFLATLENKGDVEDKAEEDEATHTEQENEITDAVEDKKMKAQNSNVPKNEDVTDLKNAVKHVKIDNADLKCKKSKECVIENESVSKCESKSSSVGIAKFFSFKTSTPGKPKKETADTKAETSKVVNSLPKSKANKKQKSTKIKKKESKLCTSGVVSDADSPINEKISCDIQLIKSSGIVKNDKEVKSNALTSDSTIKTGGDDEDCHTVKSEFLNSSNKPSVLGKTTQATLCFGKSGLIMSKSTVVNIVEDKKPSDSKTPIKLKKSAKSNKKNIEVKGREEMIDINTSESVFVTPLNKKKRKRRATIEVSDTQQDETDESGVMDESERRQSQRKKYKVTVFQMDEDRKTPIKIKLRRCPKSSSSADDGDVTSIKVRKNKLNAKLTKAQSLLEKAKKGKHKKKSKLKENADKLLAREDSVLDKEKKKKKGKKKRKKSVKDDSDSSSHRRSSRLVGRTMASMEDVSLDNIVISSDDDTDHVPVKRGRKPKSSVALAPVFASEDENSRESVPAKRGRKPKSALAVVDGTPKKSTPKKKSSDTPSKSKKSGMKLAPMFMLGKNKSGEASPKKPPLDPEQARQRQQFLMSGVPEELKKQTVTRMAAMVAADYPPIPTVNHVQQVTTISATSDNNRRQLDVWNLGSVELNLQYFLVPSLIYPRSRFTGDLLGKHDPQVDMQCIKSFQHHLPIDEAVVTECLDEVTRYNTAYPVHKMYSAMKQLRVDHAEQPTIKTDVDDKTDMTAALSDHTHVLVVDGKPETKKRGRKSLKLQKKDAEKDSTEEKKKIEEKPKFSASGLLWTEKYHPTKSSEVLGNGASLKKMKSWLSEWKHLLDKEAKKARKLLMMKNKGKLMKKKDAEEAWDDDSDFDMDSDDSEEDDSLCNTMLLVGPYGCGKTSSVYALAQELGFKVHEVNASSSRNGKHILSQLQEATQSHQVTSHSCHTPSKKPAPARPEKAQGGKMPTAFTNLFKKAVPADPSPAVEKDNGKKRKRAPDKDENPKKKRKRKDEPLLENKKLSVVVEDSNSQGLGASMNLSSTTLILFDEVDVVFEDDRGFLSAVQTFMSTTKIPIVLTTADPGFTWQFDGKSEQVTFKNPPLTSVTSHLQTIALVENLRVDPVLLSQLVQVYESDVRRCLICLQYLAESGGGHIQARRAIDKTQNAGKVFNTVIEDSQDFPLDVCSDSNVNCIKSSDLGDDDDDFVTLKPLKSKRRRIVDDNSNSVDAFSRVFVTKTREPAGLVPSSVHGEAEAGKYPVVHSLCIDSILGISGKGKVMISDALQQCLKTNSTSNQHELISICDMFKKTTRVSILYNNLHILLPMTHKLVDSVAVASIENEGKKKGKKRKRIQNDLYDSEASNDCVKSPEVEPDETDIKQTTLENKAENLCLAETLSQFTNFYDTMSSLDVMETRENMKILDRLQSCGGAGSIRGRLLGGVDNELASFPTSCSTDLDCCLTYGAEVEARSVAKLYAEVDNIQNTVEKLCENNPAFSDNFVLPVLRGSDNFTVVDTNSKSIPSELRLTHKNVGDNLPLTVHHHQRNVHLDYLPTLREICRTEQCREVANTKRRCYLARIKRAVAGKTINVAPA